MWITPDAANRGDGGGLRIYEALPPDDWNFDKANTDAEAIRDLLNAHPAYAKVPYRFNRAVLLNGHRFHETDALDFAPGFDNHRINLTFLFSRRDPDRACDFR